MAARVRFQCAWRRRGISPTSLPLLLRAAMDPAAAALDHPPIPVYSTAARRSLSQANGGGDELRPHHKPLSLWPGMYHSPVTAALWNARSTLLERAVNSSNDGPSQVNLLTRAPGESRTSVLYNFVSDVALREQYRNPWNNIRMGKLMEDLDALAGTIAMKHCADDDSTTRPLLLVTASVDKVSLKKPLRVDVDLKLAGAVAWVGRSSMKIQMQVIQPATEIVTDESLALVANFTFVARDSKTQKSAPVNHLSPETDEEKALFAATEQLELKRKQARSKQPDQADDQRVQQLLAEARVLTDMPALADKNSILIQHTKLENAIICQPQQRNLHGRIFGGFLMRRAFELAFSTCYVFGGHRPVFLEVDHVDFLRPVDVGDFLRFRSCVLYTEEENSARPKIHVEVKAIVTQPESRSSQVSNTFHFTFTLDTSSSKSGDMVVRRVLPSTEEEARRCVSRYDADH
ncbi:acyl-coenzyme A thioesterase 9, mitochondrial isoform X2 [Selaginella moellendorffii]|nr:acyl-coenzyme A thioesterase 9, mitochondrial isoform X2 [Selaginella moellendorffii]|eukprot:XP_002961453.2 acyl-coenzyme A thioesterase 9, mitochondrial isoform X2 [Selaginella moellendorffii]